MATRTERRRAETRVRLTRAARELIAEDGVASLRISSITGRADVGLGSFYNYFESKDDIVEAVVTEAIEGLAATLAAFMDSVEDPAEAVCVSNRRFIRLAYDDAELAGLLVNLDGADARFETMVFPQARSALERGVEAGRFDIPDVGVALTTAVGGALAVMRGVLEGRLGAGVDVPQSEALLRSLGIDHDQARAIAARALPEIR